MFWALICICLILTYYFGGPWGDSGTFFVLPLVLSIWQIRLGFQALTKAPVICFTTNGYDYDRGSQEASGLWLNLEMINDEPGANELYLHPKNDSPIIVSTDGLNASHEDIKAAAVEFMNASKAD